MPDGGEVSIVEVLVDRVVDYAIFALDVDGNVASWNAGAEALTGYTAEEIVGRPCSAFYRQSDLDDGLLEREYSVAAATGRFEQEGWRVRKDGTLFWASVVLVALRGDDGRLLGFGTIARDLSERKRGEDAIRESEERFRLLVSSVSDYAIFLLDPEGKISSWNIGAERLKGYRPDEVIGEHFSCFYTTEDQRAGLPATALRTALEEGRWESEGWRVRKDGSRFWANVVITALRGGDGGLRGFAKITRDLTERKTNEDALRGVLEREREAAEQLRNVDRMRRELVSMVAHDLRGPVTVVQNLLDLLLEQWPELSDDERRQRVDRAMVRAGTLAELTDDIFDLSLIDAGSLDVAAEVVDLSSLAAQVIDDANAVTGGQPLVVGAIEEWVTAQGDQRRTQQVVDNLVSNATKFSPPEQRVEVAVCRSGSEAVISVHNWGPGIPLSDQERVFDRFVRVRGNHRAPGSGLGLFIARSLAEAQGGRVTLDSSDERGTTFTFALPWAEA